MAGHAQEIEQVVQSKLESSVDAMSRETRHITLTYHQVQPSSVIELGWDCGVLTL